MYLKTVLAAVTALLFAGQAMGTAMIATDPRAFPPQPLLASQKIHTDIPVRRSLCLQLPQQLQAQGSL